MHIPDSMLHGNICPITATISTVGIGTAVYYAFKSEKKPTPTTFAAVTTLIFVAQMVNFPIANGTSGHLLGGVLAAYLLGVPFGVLAMSFVIAIQSLIFADGGIRVLGVNILNMAIIGAGLCGILQAKILSHWDIKNKKYLLIIAMAWFSTIIASIAVSVELAIDGSIAFITAFIAMVTIHTFIGLGEGLITLVCCIALSINKKSTKKYGQITIPAMGIILITLMLTPFASNLPDGLEYVAHKYNLIQQASPKFVGILPDYTVPLLTNNISSTMVAAILGIMISFAITWLFLQLINFISKKMHYKLVSFKKEQG